MVPINLEACNVAMVIDKTTRPNGQTVAIVTVSMPRVTAVIEWTEEEAKAFCQKLYEQFSGIVPATAADMPGRNGHNPGGLRSV